LKKSMCFLIVEDNPVMRRTIRHVVGDFAKKIVECDDGAKALAAYKKHQPDWVLMDVEMAEKDGLTATREICAEFPQAHILIVTKYDDAATRRAAEKAGACGFVLKENLLDLHNFF
jgi:DNA-binding NarL/FixJ family response regulator